MLGNCIIDPEEGRKTKKKKKGSKNKTENYTNK